MTGLAVYPDLNDVIRQLEMGVPAEEVTFSPVVPVAIDTRGLDRDLVQEPRLVLFVEAPTGRLLGWTSATPFTATEATVDGASDTVSDETTETVDWFIAEILAPEAGTAVDVVVVEDTAMPVCPSDLAELARLTSIPYDQMAGSQRASVSIATGRVTDLLEAQP